MITHRDHLVPTDVNLQSCIEFHTSVLGMQVQTFGHYRMALVFRAQKSNHHLKGQELESKVR